MKKRSFTEIIEKHKKKIPSGDYSSCDFDGVNLYGCHFEEDCVLPNDRDLFMRIHRRDLSGVTLPIINLSLYSFDGVCINATVFHAASGLPTDRDFFVKIHLKTLLGTCLPDGDYSGFNFNDVMLMRTKFTRESKIPMTPNFFTNLYRGQSYQVTFPEGDYSDSIVKEDTLQSCIFLGNSIPPISNILQMDKREVSEYIQDKFKGKYFYKIEAHHLAATPSAKRLGDSIFSVEQQLLLCDLLAESK